MNCYIFYSISHDKPHRNDSSLKMVPIDFRQQSDLFSKKENCFRSKVCAVDLYIKKKNSLGSKLLINSYLKPKIPKGHLFWDTLYLIEITDH